VRGRHVHLERGLARGSEGAERAGVLLPRVGGGRLKENAD
jgi:hypothetical protein